MSFVPHHTLVVAPGRAPDRFLFVLHGILGSGTNLRTFAKQLANARPEWGMVLVDLRMHGASQNAPAPHTVASAAEDLVRLETTLAGSVRGVIGHSFGGKVALDFATRKRDELEVAFILDANPGVRDLGKLEANAIVSMLAAMPDPLPSRERFFELVAERGIDRKTAEWLAMLVRPSGDVFRIRLDLKAIRDLLADYAALDLWPVIETKASKLPMHVVVGGRSDAFSPTDRARLARDAEAFPNVFMHVLENAGHNVHIDDPDGLLAVIANALEAPA